MVIRTRIVNSVPMYQVNGRAFISVRAAIAWRSLVPVPRGTGNDLLEELTVLGDVCSPVLGLLVPECNVALAL